MDILLSDIILVCLTSQFLGDAKYIFQPWNIPQLMISLISARLDYNL